MGSPSFDRQIFVKKKEPSKPPSRSPLPGGLALLLVAALSAFATYRYVKAGGTLPANTADKAQIAQLQAKLKATQARVKELEKQRHYHHPDPAGPVAAKADAHKAKPKTTSNNTLLAENAPHLSSAAAGALKHSAAPKKESLHSAAGSNSASNAPPKTDTAKVKPSGPHAETLLASNQPAVSSKQLNALQGNLEASHQEWQATVNRLGSVVGELDTQRSALQKTQSGVNYLLERAQRANVAFTLHRGKRYQRVGPISMKLDSASVKGQHYTIRMVVDDKSVVLKDRALNEIVEFYTSQSKYPLRLIVSNIERNEVSGTLAVPSMPNPQNSPNPQLQER